MTYSASPNAPIAQVDARPGDAATSKCRLVGVGELPTRGIHRILLLRPNHRLGNTLLLTPLLTELERRFPGAEVDVVTGCEAATEVFGGFRQIRRIHQLTRRPGHHPLHLLRTVLAIRRSHYDLAIDSARGSHSGRLLLRLSGARYRLGLPCSERELHDCGTAWQDAMKRAPTHFALDGIHALRCALGIGSTEESPAPTLRLALRPEELAAGGELLKDLLGTDASEGGPVVVLFPNATGNKRLSGDWWQAMVDALLRHDPSLRFVEMVAAHGKSQLGLRFPAFYSSDIRRMAALMAQCDAYISGDCGVMHLACAAGVPTLGLFTRENLPRYRPYGPHDASLYVKDLAPADAADTAAAFLRRLPRHRAAAVAAA